MQIDFAFQHMTPSDSLREYASEKSEKLKKYFQGRIHVKWNMAIEKIDKIARCHLVGNNMDFVGETKDEDFKAAIDLTIDKIEKQLKKHKEIIKDHHKS